MQRDAERHHRGKRSQNLFILRGQADATPTSLLPTVFDSERVNFRSAMHDMNAKLVLVQIKQHLLNCDIEIF